MNKKIKLILFIFVIIIVIGSLISYNYFYKTSTKTSANQINIENISRTEVGTEQVNLILYVLGAQELHKPFLSRDTPKIELIVGDEVYSAEIIDNSFLTRGGNIENPDIRVYTSREEFIAILNSDIKSYLQESVSEGKTRIEMVAGKTRLATKGYLSLYREITGKSFPI